MTNKLGINKDDQKRRNRGNVIKLVATGKCNTRINLSKELGLTKTAISNIVAGLIDEGLMFETKVTATQEVGRNPIKLTVSPSFPKFIGLVVQRGYCEAVVCDLQLNILRQERINGRFSSADELMEVVYELVDHMLEVNQPIVAIGVGAIGPVQINEGMIANPNYFENVHDVRIRDLLEERYKLPVYFDHDNQSAVLAEHLYGNGRGYEDVLLVGIMGGIGCGVLVGGHRMHSHIGHAPEIGHITIKKDGNKCICGNRGCLETYVNSDIIRNKLREATGLDYSFEEFMHMKQDENFKKIMREQIECLSAGIISVQNMLNSQIIILALDCCFWPDWCIQEIEEKVNERKFNGKDTIVPVVKPYFLQNVQVLGAATNAISRVFRGELI